MYECTHPSVRPFILPASQAPVHPSSCPSIHPSICLTDCLSVCLFVCVSIDLFICVCWCLCELACACPCACVRVCACVRAYVRVCVRASASACLCVRVRMRAIFSFYGQVFRSSQIFYQIKHNTICTVLPFVGSVRYTSLALCLVLCSFPSVSCASFIFLEREKKN